MNDEERFFEERLLEAQARAEAQRRLDDEAAAVARANRTPEGRCDGGCDPCADGYHEGCDECEPRCTRVNDEAVIGSADPTSEPEESYSF